MKKWYNSVRSEAFASFLTFIFYLILWSIMCITDIRVPISNASLMSFPVNTVSSSMILYHFFIAFLLSFVLYINIIVHFKNIVNSFVFLINIFLDFFPLSFYTSIMEVINMVKKISLLLFALLRLVIVVVGLFLLFSKAM